MTADHIKLKRDGSVAIVAVDRADKRNAFSLAMWTRTADLLEELAGDPTVSVVTLHGLGGSFSAGADVGEFERVRATTRDTAAYEAQVDRCVSAIENLPKPTIAAISGCCLGGGVALALGCDFRIADRSAYFAVPAAKLGLVYNIEKCRRLMSVIGAVNTKLMLLSGRRFDATEALELGLVERLAEEDVVTAALEFAGQFENSLPLSVSGMKMIVNSVMLDEVEARRERIRQAIENADSSADHRDAVHRFNTKSRKPSRT